jgi:hypothetical protein
MVSQVSRIIDILDFPRQVDATTLLDFSDCQACNYGFPIRSICELSRSDSNKTTDWEGNLANLQRLFLRHVGSWHDDGAACHDLFR